MSSIMRPYFTVVLAYLWSAKSTNPNLHDFKIGNPLVNLLLFGSLFETQVYELIFFFLVRSISLLDSVIDQYQTLALVGICPVLSIFHEGLRLGKVHVFSLFAMN